MKILLEIAKVANKKKVKKIEIFDSVLKSFFLDDRETVKFQVIRSLKKMLFLKKHTK